MMRLKGALTALLLVAVAAPAAAQDKQPPYWASIASGEAMARTGPGRNYPGIWLYKRRDLPIRVVKKYENWRMIEDPDGARGWMLVSLLSDRRTAIVKKGDPRPIHVKPDEGSAVRYRAEIPLDREIDGTFRGSLNYVISRVLNGHSYVVKHDGTMIEILVIGVWQANPSASSYEDDEPTQRRRRRRSRY